MPSTKKKTIIPYARKKVRASERVHISVRKSKNTRSDNSGSGTSDTVCNIQTVPSEQPYPQNRAIMSMLQNPEALSSTSLNLEYAVDTGHQGDPQSTHTSIMLTLPVKPVTLSNQAGPVPPTHTGYHR